MTEVRDTIATAKVAPITRKGFLAAAAVGLVGISATAPASAEAQERAEVIALLQRVPATKRPMLLEITEAMADYTNGRTPKPLSAEARAHVLKAYQGEELPDSILAILAAGSVPRVVTTPDGTPYTAVPLRARTAEEERIIGLARDYRGTDERIRGCQIILRHMEGTATAEELAWLRKVTGGNTEHGRKFWREHTARVEAIQKGRVAA